MGQGAEGEAAFLLYLSHHTRHLGLAARSHKKHTVVLTEQPAVMVVGWTA